MVVVPAGQFLMGSPNNEEGHRYWENPQRKVRVSKPFAIGKFPITRAEFSAFVKVTGYSTDEGCYTKIGNDWTLQTDTSWRSPGHQ
jgi:formylglycine-generating enzyme required for sulfatase activity